MPLADADATNRIGMARVRWVAKDSAPETIKKDKKVLFIFQHASPLMELPVHAFCTLKHGNDLQVTMAMHG